MTNFFLEFFYDCSKFGFAPLNRRNGALVSIAKILSRAVFIICFGFVFCLLALLIWLVCLFPVVLISLISLIVCAFVTWEITGRIKSRSHEEQLKAYNLTLNESTLFIAAYQSPDLVRSHFRANPRKIGPAFRYAADIGT